MVWTEFLKQNQNCSEDVSSICTCTLIIICKRTPETHKGYSHWSGYCNW